MLLRILYALIATLLVMISLSGCCCCVPGFQPMPPMPDERAQPFVQNPPPVVQKPQPQPKPDPEPKPEPEPEPKPKKKKTKQPPEIKIDPDDPSAPKLEADPLPLGMKAPVDPTGIIKLPLSTINNPIRYPWGPGPIVAVSTVNKKKDTDWVVWNLQSMTELGSVPGSTGSDVFLSNDGAYLAMPAFAPGAVSWRDLQFFTVPGGKSVRTIHTRFATDSTIGVMDFAGPGRFLSVQSSGRDGQAKVWDLKTGDEVSTFKTEGLVNRPYAAISPGGRYLAMYQQVADTRHIIHLYEVMTGKEAGVLKIKIPRGFHVCKGLAFSHDGTALAILMNDSKGDYLQAWSFKTGNRSADHYFATPLDRTAKNTLLHPTPIEWLPDGSGWCAYGQLLIDHKRGNIFWTIPSDPKVSLIARRWLDAEHYAKVVTSTRPWQLEIFTLPKAELDAARRK